MYLGVDVGGTKIEAIVLSNGGMELARKRILTPQGKYRETVNAISSLVAELEKETSSSCQVGVGTPGSISPATGRMQNCNSTCLNGEDLKADLETALQREIKLANDADCLALSEALDGAGKGYNTVFAVILGTGVGGGSIVNGTLVTGPNALTGEWGHTPIPRTLPARPCYCGRINCVETWLSGPALEQSHFEQTGAQKSADQIDLKESKALDKYMDLLALSLGSVINSIDPECIVFGGGLSNIDRLYTELPLLTAQYIMPDTCRTTFKKAVHGDSSGVLGAARLWL